MKYRKLGKTDWYVSEIGYGMWGMAGWTGSDDDESYRALQLAVDLGCTFFDTAWGDIGDVSIVEIYRMDNGNMILDSVASSSYGDLTEKMVYDKQQ